jgi:hypothetical protein
MKIKIQKIIDKNITVPINSNIQRIEQIKNEFAACKDEQEFCKVEVLDMWEDSDK